MKTKTFSMLFIMLVSSVLMKAEDIYFYDNGLRYKIYRNLIGEYDSNVFLIKSDEYKDFTEVTVPDYVTYAGAARRVYFSTDNMFENCQKLERVQWQRENGLPNKCFKNCNNLSILDVAHEKWFNGVGEEALAGCVLLKEFTFFPSLDYLGLHAFKGVKLEKLHWNATWCGGTFYGEEMTGEGTNGATNSDDGLPFTITTWMGMICMALDSCIDVTSVKEVIIGDNVEALPLGFMHGAQIAEVTIPASVHHLYGGSFEDCTKLRKIICRVANPASIHLGNIEFKGVDKELCTLYVPKGSAELYRNAEQWKEFQNIVEEGEEEHDPYDLNGDGQVDVTDVGLLIDRILGK